MVNRFPFAIEEKTQQELSFDESIAANFITILNRMNLDTEHIVKISEILWPVMFIQSEPNAKLVLDNVGVLFFEEKIVNAPRTAQVGHILRNQDLFYLERLRKVKSIIKFQESIELSSQKSEISQEEYIFRKIRGLFPPYLLKCIGKMMLFVQPLNLAKFDLLESQYTFDDAIDFAQEWLDLLNFIRGTRHRWKSLKELIQEPIEKWKLDLKVQLKDIESFYKKKIRNFDQLDDSMIKSKLDEAKNNIDRWVLQEQKSIIERIGKLFVGINILFEKAIEQNKDFLQLDTLKTRKIGDVVVNAYQNIAFLRDTLEKSNEELDEISSKINTIRENVEKTNLTAEEKIKLLQKELQDQKKNQEQKIMDLKKEKEEKIISIQKNLNNLIELEKEIYQIIEQKMTECNIHEKKIKEWQISDEITKIRNPTSKFYIPIGIALIEDNDFEERLEIVFPSIFGQNLHREYFSEKIPEFEKSLSEILEENMKLRSNFEFTCEKSQDFKKNIQNGIKSLFNKGLINIKMKQKYTSILTSME
ncbi:MAG: hypothetical protein K9W44_02125 [Candidatus Lokiarchaeota archaeon]|nr:hypothetical protein [Candidatus Harpocratesius repetitus]